MGREGIQLFRNGVSKNRTDIRNLKNLFFLAILKIPAKECFQYDSKIKMLTTE